MKKIVIMVVCALQLCAVLCSTVFGETAHRRPLADITFSMAYQEVSEEIQISVQFLALSKDVRYDVDVTLEKLIGTKWYRYYKWSSNSGSGMQFFVNGTIRCKNIGACFRFHVEGEMISPDGIDTIDCYSMGRYL